MSTLFKNVLKLNPNKKELFCSYSTYAPVLPRQQQINAFRILVSKKKLLDTESKGTKFQEKEHNLKTPLFSIKPFEDYDYDMDYETTGSKIITTGDSKIKIELDFKHDLALRQSFISEDGQFLFSKLFEAIDQLAYDVAYKHSQSYTKVPAFMVTSSCDKIEIPKNIDLNKKLVITGKIVHVGKSSMDLVIEVEQDGKKIVRAFFTMLAKEKYSLAPLELKRIEFEDIQKEDKEDYEENKIQDKLLSLHLEMKQNPPNRKEISLIHDLFLTQDSKTLISSTIETCQKKENETFLSTIFENSLKSVKKVTENPVPKFIIGKTKQVENQEIKFQSQVVYSEDFYYLVKTESNFQTYFTLFEGKEMKKIQPKSYQEVILFIEGKRIFDRIKLNKL